MGRKVKVAIAQYEAEHSNLEKSLQKLESIVISAKKDGVGLLVFGETWLSGYPAWLDHCPEVAQWDNESVKSAFLKLRQSSVEIGDKHTNFIAKLAKTHKLNIVIGVNEKVSEGPGNGTIYNALLTFNIEGQLTNHHRKLMPTFTEKMLYGQGDAHGLNAPNTSVGRVGGLICWEHWMPLARQAMHNEAEDIHVAVWPTVFERHQIASRQYAFEGRCFVLAAGQLLKASDFPDELKLPDYLEKNPEQLVCNGGSCIINPKGEYIIEPIFDKETLLTAEIDLDDRVKEQMTLDVTGHYQRDDIFDFKVNKTRKD
ncbi:carbon-nitrogen hydrolase family protein [Fulvivirga sp. RKSG066]|uniref:carbon-nitrogen hydrolase family protein n=1 Tax=Fulvivirga aurantia TaxID=2529383 RepID=UPI0012BC6254|nr:carbon-nitrogen hydrolase family protein [Fulvivirga aurantia]MTI21484.1 carbon-nitrogen hydrolase family protein [Fulvivirga aurantia]